MYLYVCKYACIRIRSIRVDIIMHSYLNEYANTHFCIFGSACLHYTAPSNDVLLDLSSVNHICARSFVVVVVLRQLASSIS